LVQCGPFDAIWYSDRLISTGVSDAAVIELERVLDDMKDWHYCIVYVRTSYADLTCLDGSMTDAEYHQVQRESPKVLPESFEEYTGELEKTVAPYSLRGKTIQCIIKLANIHLTADNPEYGGGSWRVEGDHQLTFFLSV
jgi:hypothetical protein